MVIGLKRELTTKLCMLIEKWCVLEMNQCVAKRQDYTSKLGVLYPPPKWFWSV